MCVKTTWGACLRILDPTPTLLNGTLLVTEDGDVHFQHSPLVIPLHTKVQWRASLSWNGERTVGDNVEKPAGSRLSRTLYSRQLYSAGKQKANN